MTWRNESIVSYGYAASLYTPQAVFLSNLHEDRTENVVASPLSLQDSVHFIQPLLRCVPTYQCSQFYMPRHLKINLHSHEIQIPSRPVYVEDVCKHLADDTKFT